MLKWDTALGAINKIEKCELNDEANKDLKKELYQSAIKYARIRTDWYLLSLKDRAEMESSRTRAHDSFIDCCNALSRHMQKSDLDNSWRKQIGSDRRDIGDFACYIHAWLGLKAR